MSKKWVCNSSLLNLNYALKQQTFIMEEVNQEEEEVVMGMKGSNLQITKSMGNRQMTLLDNVSYS